MDRKRINTFEKPFLNIFASDGSYFCITFNDIPELLVKSQIINLSRHRRRMPKSEKVVQPHYGPDVQSK